MTRTPWAVFNMDPGREPESYRQLRSEAMDVEPIVMRRDTRSRMEGGEARVNILHTLVYHSTTGFEWGYGGSGPSDLALNVLAMFVEPPEAWRLHQSFKGEVIARIPDLGATLLAKDVVRWIERRWAKDAEAIAS